MSFIRIMNHALVIQQVDMHDLRYSIRRKQISDPEGLFQEGYLGRQYWIMLDSGRLVGFVSFRYSDFSQRLYILDQLKVSRTKNEKDRDIAAGRLVTTAMTHLLETHQATININITPPIEFARRHLESWQVLCPETVHIT